MVFLHYINKPCASSSIVQIRKRYIFVCIIKDAFFPCFGLEKRCFFLTTFVVSGRNYFLTCYIPLFNCRPVVPGVAGGVPWYPQILADQLSLSQPGGADYAHQITLAPTSCQNFIQPYLDLFDM